MRIPSRSSLAGPGPHNAVVILCRQVALRRHLTGTRSVRGPGMITCTCVDGEVMRKVGDGVSGANDPEGEDR